MRSSQEWMLASLTSVSLALGIVQCLEAHDACQGLEYSISSIHQDRMGSFWLDFINFKRKTVTSGWRFDALGSPSRSTWLIDTTRAQSGQGETPAALGMVVSASVCVELKLEARHKV